MDKKSGVVSSARPEQIAARNQRRAMVLRKASRFSADIRGKEIIVDLFAGGGGFSEGMLMALSREPDVAVNHDAAAIGMHIANHPDTHHLIADVREVAPREAAAGRPVGLLHASSDCTFFSRARGAAPMRSDQQRIRMLPWMLWKWAKQVRPRMITAENVPEIMDWGPTVPKRDSRSVHEHDKYGNPLFIPDERRRGETYSHFIGALERLGYEVQTRVLHAHEYGCATRRKRWFMVARCDGLPISWPTPSHGPAAGRPFVSQAGCIDFSVPAASIFDRDVELAEKTQERLARGIERFVLDPRSVFVIDRDDARGLVRCGYMAQHNAGGYTGCGHGLTEPMSSITTSGSQQQLVLVDLVDATRADPKRSGQVTEWLQAHLGRRCAAVMLDGTAFVPVDVRQRMLTPRELYRCMGFRDDYIIDPIAMYTTPAGKSKIGRLPISEQRAKVGNSVPPPLAAAILRANLFGTSVCGGLDRRPRGSSVQEVVSRQRRAGGFGG